MDLHNSIMDLHDSIMVIYTSGIMDLHNSIMEINKYLWKSIMMGFCPLWHYIHKNHIQNINFIMYK